MVVVGVATGVVVDVAAAGSGGGGGVGVGVVVVVDDDDAAIDVVDETIYLVERKVLLMWSEEGE